MRRLIIGPAAVLAFLALPVLPAHAQGLTVTFSSGENPGYRPALFEPAPRPRPVYVSPGYGYRHDRWRRRHQYRKAFYGPPCFIRVERYWNGHEWVRERRRICR
jgi:hypothetical protein